MSSLLNQDFEDFEILIVDDGSTDGTVDVVQAIIDPRIKLILLPQNIGGNAARNRGVREAEGSIICFLDSDDEFLPHKLSTIAHYFCEHPQVDAVIDSFVLLYPPEQRRQKVMRRNPALDSSIAIEQAIFSRRLYKATPALSARMEALVKVGLFDETLRRRQDMDLVLRLARQTEIRSIGDVLWTKHWTAGAISSKQETFMAALLDMCSRYPDYLVRPTFRQGLARDFSRHFIRLAIQGRAGAIRRDIGEFNARHSQKEALSLGLQGLWELAKRAVSRG